MQTAADGGPSPGDQEAGVRTAGPGVGIMEADDRQVTTVFTVQRPFHHWHWQTEYHEAIPSSANGEVRCDCTFADDGKAS